MFDYYDCENYFTPTVLFKISLNEAFICHSQMYYHDYEMKWFVKLVCLINEETDITSFFILVYILSTLHQWRKK